jgi:hypothetical protein
MAWTQFANHEPHNILAEIFSAVSLVNGIENVGEFE